MCASPTSRRRAAPPRVFAARRQGESTRQGVAEGLAILQQRTHALGVPFTIDVFGLTTSATGDMGIGQVWEDLVSSADAVLPMVYPSHYNRGEYGFAHPNAEPYGDHQEGAAGRHSPFAETRWQDCGDPPLPAGVHAGSADGTARSTCGPRSGRGEELGVTSWVLWNPRSVYERGQITPEAQTGTHRAWPVTATARRVQTAEVLRWRRDEGIRTIPEERRRRRYPAATDAYLRSGDMEMRTRLGLLVAALTCIAAAPAAAQEPSCRLASRPP